MLSAFGVGGPSVDTVLDSSSAHAGDVLSGRVSIQGGTNDVVIDSVVLSLVTRVEVEHAGGEASGVGEFHRVVLQRDVKVTEFTWCQMDLVEGHYLQTTSNVDQSRTVAFIGMNQMKLYIFEGTVPKGSPQPFLFQVSQGWVDKSGNGYRYRSMYNNQFHEIEGVPRPQANIQQD